MIGTKNGAEGLKVEPFFNYHPRPPLHLRYELVNYFSPWNSQLNCGWKKNFPLKVLSRMGPVGVHNVLISFAPVSTLKLFIFTAQGFWFKLIINKLACSIRFYEINI